MDRQTQDRHARLVGAINQALAELGQLTDAPPSIGDADSMARLVLLRVQTALTDALAPAAAQPPQPVRHSASASSSSSV